MSTLNFEQKSLPFRNTDILGLLQKWSMLLRPMWYKINPQIGLRQRMVKKHLERSAEIASRAVHAVLAPCSASLAGVSLMGPADYSPDDFGVISDYKRFFRSSIACLKPEKFLMLQQTEQP